jgi:hypothetical protein
MPSGWSWVTGRRSKTCSVPSSRRAEHQKDDDPEEEAAPGRAVAGEDDFLQAHVRRSLPPVSVVLISCILPKERGHRMSVRERYLFIAKGQP